jgi:hypothetical protein
MIDSEPVHGMPGLRRPFFMLNTLSLADIITVSEIIEGRLNIKGTLAPGKKAPAKIVDYYPIASSVALARAMMSYPKGRSYLLIGSPGSGKSTAGLFTSFLFSGAVEDMSVYPLWERIYEKDRTFAALVRTLRDQGRRYLLLLPGEMEGLKSIDGELKIALNSALYREEIDFVPQAKADFRTNLQEVCEFLAARDEHNGILIVFDNFDPYLREILKNPEGEDAACYLSLLNFMRSSTTPVLFLGIASLDYQALDQQRIVDLRGFFDEIYPLFLVQEEGEAEEMIAGVIQSKAAEKTQSELLAHDDFRVIGADLFSAGLYRKRSREWLDLVVLKRGYPLHPLTVYCLPRLAQKLSTPERSFFSFFFDNSPGGFQYYIANTSVLGAGGRLSLYTVDMLFTYFDRGIRESPRFGILAGHVDKAAGLLGEVPQGRRILRLIAVLQIVDSRDLRPTAETVFACLHGGQKEAVQVEEALRVAVKKGIVKFNEVTGEYSLPPEKTRVRIESVLPEHRNKVDAEFDIHRFLTARFKPPSFTAKERNSRRGGDRRAASYLIQPSRLEDPDEIRKTAEAYYASPRPYYRGDAAIFYVLTDSYKDVSRLKESLLSEAFESPHIIVAFSRKPLEIEDQARRIEALERVRKHESPFNEAGTEENAEVSEMIGETTRELRAEARDLFKAENYTWYWKREAHEVKNGEESEFLSRIFDEIFSSELSFRNGALTHHRPRKGEAGEMRRAVERILAADRPVILSPGLWYPYEKIITEACIETGILSPRSDGGREIAEEAQGESPVAALWRTLSRNMSVFDGGKRAFQPESLLGEWSRPPLGMTLQAQILLMALALRKFHGSIEVFSNFKEVLSSGRSEVLRRHDVTFETMATLVRNPSDWVVINTEATDAERGYLEDILRIFAPGRALKMEGGLWDQAREAMREWFETLPPLATKAKDFGSAPTGAFLLLLLSEKSEKDSRRIFTGEIPAALGFDAESFLPDLLGKTIIEALTKAVEELEGYFNAVSDRILNGVAEIFGCEESQLENGVRSWLAGLPPNLLERSDLDGAKLLRVLRGETPVMKAFLEDLPAGFGLGIIDSWESDRSAAFLAHVAAAKKEVELSRFLDVWPVSPDDPAQKERAVLILRAMAAECGIPREEMEEIITELLEQIAWA